MSFWIVTDAACDLPASYLQNKSDLTVIPTVYRIDGREYTDKPGDEAAVGRFYDMLRDGRVATTSQITPVEYQRVFRDLVKQGREVLCVTFSSGLSGTYQSAVLAKSFIEDEIPGAKIVVVDSLCASLGEGLLVHYTLQKRDEGLSIDDTAEWVISNRQRLNHWFTVDDLMFLYRGGRVNATSAYLGSMLRIKPVMHVNYEGKLIPREKVQGRKRSLKALAQKVADLAVPRDGQTVFISHGDVLEEAQYTMEHIKELVKVKESLISPVGAYIGAHSGPGTVAVFFMGESR